MAEQLSLSLLLLTGGKNIFYACVFLYIYLCMCIYIHLKIIISLVKMEEKGPSLSESMAKSPSAGGSICLYIYINE